MNVRSIRSARCAVLAVVIAASALAGCAGNPSKVSSPIDYTGIGKEDCIFRRTMDDWSVLDRSHLIIYGMGTQEPYLIQLNFPSNDIDFNLGIGVLDADHDGRICGNGFDSILIPGGSPNRIEIVSVKRLTPAEAKALMDIAHPKKRARGKVAPEGAGGG